MKLAFIITFAILFNVIVAEQQRRDRPALKKNHKRGSELAHEIYAKRDVANNIRIPYYPPYYGNQYQCELCCNGTRLNGQFPYSVSCCGNTVFDSNTAVCCGDKPVSFDPTPNSYQWQCCGSGLYNTSTQLCCGSTTFDKGSLEQCCGDQKFNALQSICCGTKVLPRPSYATWSCCGDEIYDTTQNQCTGGSLAPLAQGVQNYQCGTQTINFEKQICCNNAAVPREDSYTLCCGILGYQSNKAACCGDKIIPSINATQSCCGNQLIDITTQTCCNNVPVTTKTGKDCNSYSCCGTELYSYSDTTTLCCNDQINRISSPPTNGPPSSGVAIPVDLPAIIIRPSPNSYQCCGSAAYNPQTDTCCSDQDSNSNVVSGQNANCCGLKTYDSTKNTCCNNTLYDAGNVPDNMCCCPNGGCNNYIRYPYPGPILY